MAMPVSMKALKPFLVISKQFESKDPVVSYYVLFYAVQEGMKVYKEYPDTMSYIMGLMDMLENKKKATKTSDMVLDEYVGQAYMEETAFKLFDSADLQDRASKFTKSLAKMFFTASQLFMTLKQFGELSEEIEGKMKYAKWKAVELDKCFKTGTTPMPGPPGGIQDPLDNEPPTEQHLDFNQPGPSSSVQPGPSYGYDQPPIGFDLPPVPSNQFPSIQPQLPPEIKPVPKPRHDNQTPATGMYPSSADITPPPVVMSQPPPTLQAAGPVATLGPNEAAKAKKYCLWAGSALEYDDNAGAVEYLTKALNLIRTGKE